MKTHFLLVAALLSLSLAACCTMQAETAKLTAPRKFTIIPIANPRSLAIDAAGNLYVGDAGDGAVYKLSPDGTSTMIGGAGAASISDPLGLGVARDGSVFVANASGGGVFRITPGGSATAIAKPPADQQLVTPIGVAIDSAGNAFIANNGNNCILKITPGGEVKVFAGNPGTAGSADGAGTAATFATPRGIAIDAHDNLYVADEGNSNIRKITPAGVVTTLAGAAGESGAVDGAGPAARFGAPRSLAAAADGTVYVADTDTNLVRKITPAGIVSTLAGKAGEAGNADGPAAAARFSEPRGIAVDSAGNVFVADTGNAAVRQITPAGVVSTIAAATAPGAATKP